MHGLNMNMSFVHKVSRNLKRMLSSLLAHSNDVVVNLHVLTDEETQLWVEETILNVIGRHLTEGVVFDFEDNNVTLRREYLGGGDQKPTLLSIFLPDVDQLARSIDGELLATMRKLFG